MASVRKRAWTTAAGQPRSAWVADYFDQNRKRHEKAFPTQKAAKAWLIETQGEITRGVHTPERQSATLTEAAGIWLRHAKAEGVERSTLRGYCALVRHIAPRVLLGLNPKADTATDTPIELAGLKLARLSTPLIEAWRDKLLERHTRRLAGKILGALKSILSEAQRRGLVAQNVALPVSIEISTRDKKKLVPGLNMPDRAAVRSLLAACT